MAVCMCIVLCSRWSFATEFLSAPAAQCRNGCPNRLDTFQSRDGAGPPAIQKRLFFFRLLSSSANSALRRRRRRCSSSRVVSIRNASALASRAISSNSFEIFTVFRYYSLFAPLYEQCCTSRPIERFIEAICAHQRRAASLLPKRPIAWQRCERFPRS